MCVECRPRVTVRRDNFWHQLAEELREDHTVYRIFTNKPYSMMTRPQWLTCFFWFERCQVAPAADASSYIASSFTASALFHGTNNNSAGQFIVVGIITSAITFPSLALFVSMFMQVTKSSPCFL